MKKTTFRLSLPFLLLFLAFTQHQENSSNKYDEDFDIGTLKSVGIDSLQISLMTKAIVSGEYPDVHSVLIYKDEKLVYENYFSGKDEILGDPIGLIDHSMETLHDVRSVSKSIVSACIGIAIDQGKIKDENQRLVSIFPEYAELQEGEKAKLTIKHLLTMTSGLEWNEMIPYSDPANFEIRMEKSPDPVRFVLERKLLSTPGEQWNYNGGCTEVLAAIIFKVSGMEVDSFANKHLFEPLGIKRFEWTKFPTQTARKSIPAAASGLRLTSRDLLKFGSLYMNDGKWKGRQILSESWVMKSHKSYIERDNIRQGYGYQFWIEKEDLKGKPTTRAVSIGNGGQRIFFDHQNNLLVITTAGLYNQWDIKNNTDALLPNFVYRALLK